MADASSSGSGAGNAVETGAAQLEARERLVSKSLKSSREKLWVQSQAFAERSRIRTARGDHAGALRDAKRGLTLFPHRIEYLIRVAEALLDCGHAEQASKTAEKAKKAIEAADEDSVDVDTRASLTRLSKRLGAIDLLPNEVLATIFELVYRDWQRLPSPFQLCHVNMRWREVAFSTPSLWRDTRILRVAMRLGTMRGDLPIAVRQPPHFAHEAFVVPDLAKPHPKTSHHLRLLNLCDSLSHSTLQHFEYHTLSPDPGLAEGIFGSVRKSAATLRSVSIVQKTGTCWDREQSLGLKALPFVLHCPDLVNLELSAGPIWSNVSEQVGRDLLGDGPVTQPSLRSVSLGFEDCCNLDRLPLARPLFLLRASQVQRLTLLDTPRYFDDYQADYRKVAGALLTSCATSLEELNATACLQLFDAAREAGATGFPRLQRLRHIFKIGDTQAIPRVPFFALPKLEVIEAPVNIVQALARLPARVVLHISRDLDLPRVCRWLESLHDDCGIQHLALEVQYRAGSDAFLNALLDVLTPSVLGKVVCPRLVTFEALCRDALRRDGVDGHVFALDFAPRRKPDTRDQWEGFFDASRLVRVEAERRRVSQGLPAEHNQPAQLPAPFKRGAMPEPSSPDEPSAPTVLPPCEALRSIKIESCFVRSGAWVAMKASPCEFAVTPDPDEMIKLPWEGPQRKTQSGER